MGTRLYVGNIPWGITEDELKDFFKKAGNVDTAKIITDRDTGKSKGFGFIDMATEEEAKKAIEILNETEFKGRKVVVNEARPRREDS